MKSAQKAAIAAANAILAQAGLPLYKAKQSLVVEVPNLVAPIDLARLVKISPSPFLSQWEVAGGGRKWNGRIGRHVGVLEVNNARSYGILLQFADGDIQAFNPHDLFPWRGEPVQFEEEGAAAVV
ncbi:hypothetical protein ACUVZD_000198 [Pseudomonas aeruginosa]